MSQFALENSCYLMFELGNCIFVLQDCFLNRYFINLGAKWVVIAPSLIITSILYLKVNRKLRMPTISSHSGSLSTTKQKLADCFGMISALFVVCYVPYAMLLCADEVMRFLNVEIGLG